MPVRAFSQAGFVRVIKREYRGAKNGLPRFPIPARSAPFGLTAKQSVRLPFSKKQGGEDYSLLIPSQLRVLCRGKYFFSKFQDGSVRRLKRFLARLPVFRAEQASQLFFDKRPSVSVQA